MNNRLAHLIEAGSDISLIPSHYEPCGLTAMYGLKYGTLPIARATGGLYEIVQDYDQTSDRGTGFLFFAKLRRRSGTRSSGQTTLPGRTALAGDHASRDEAGLRVVAGGGAV